MHKHFCLIPCHDIITNKTIRITLYSVITLS